MPPWVRSTFAALAVPDFRILWAGTWLAFTGFFMSMVVQSVVAFELVGDNTAVGSVVFAQGVAMLTLAPIGGALADRLPKRRVVALGQGVTASVFVSLGLLMATDRIALPFLMAGSLVMGAAFAFLGPARQALVVEVVPDAVRGNAIALSQVANTGSRVVGPAIAGLLLALPAVGAAGAYGAMATCYALSASLLLFLPRSHVPPGGGRGLLEDVLEGLRYVARTPRLRTLLLLYTLVIMAGFPHITLLPGLLENELGREAEDVSALFGLSAAGALTASLSLARFADSPRGPAIFVATGIAFGLALLGLASAPSFAHAGVAMFALGAASGGFQALGTAVVAHESDPALIGRVLSLTMLAFAGFGLMGLPVGLMADALGERHTIRAMSAVATLLSVGMALSLRSRGRRRARSR